MGGVWGEPGSAGLGEGEGRILETLRWAGPEVIDIMNQLALAMDSPGTY